MKLNYILFLLLSLIFSGKAIAQHTKSEKIKPQWLHKLPQPSNNTFEYEIDFATGKSEKAALESSLNSLIVASGFEVGSSIIQNVTSQMSHSQRYSNGRETDEQIDDFRVTNEIKGKELELYVKRIATYWTRDFDGTYNMRVLYAKSLNKTPNFDNVELRTDYGIHGLWRSAIVPGWGQLYKGSNLKGGLILGGTVALIGGIIFTENQRTDYANKILKTHDAAIKKSYATKQDHFATGRNICVGALAALYVYNLVDAIVAPGARRIVVKKGHNGRSYAFLPSFSEEGSPVMTASVTF